MNVIAYYRVSTKRQGESGLGLAAQKKAVADYVAGHRGSIKREYKEVESGKRDDNRPKLREAIAHARGIGATLVIAKLDRLARNVAFTATLMEEGVDFVACDNPTANRLTIHILAAVAEAEAKATSERTIAALAAAKAKGKKLGSARRGHWKGREDRRLAGAAKGQPLAVEAASAKRRKAAADAYGYLMEGIQAARAEGKSLAAIAAELNERGERMRTPRNVKREDGKLFTATAIYRLLKRAG